MILNLLNSSCSCEIQKLFGKQIIFSLNSQTPTQVHPTRCRNVCTEDDGEGPIKTPPPLPYPSRPRFKAYLF